MSGALLSPSSAVPPPLCSPTPCCRNASGVEPFGASGPRPRLLRRVDSQPRRLLELQTGNSVQLNKHIYLQMGRHSNVLLSTTRPNEAGDSLVRSEELCTIVWSLEVDILEGHCIFITGDPITLGCWEPDTAILLAPSLQRTDILTAEIKVPYGSHFKYNYFMKDERLLLSDIVWRPGPECSVSVPFVDRENEVIVVRDSWIRSKRGLPANSWGSWLMKTNDTNNQFGYNKISQDLTRENGEDQMPQMIGEHIMFKIHNGYPMHREKKIVETADNVVVSGTSTCQSLSPRDQPVEEPWLSLTNQSEVTTCEPADLSQRSFAGQDDSKRLAPLNELKSTTTDAPSTLILINSSVCTMQRIAVLEDGKLVELLLEPVKNNVQCDSIYLGVVTKLVPHMGGAFVDIGISRPSLMGIKHNREPFVYVSHSKGLKEDTTLESDNVFTEDSATTHQEMASCEDVDEDDIITEELVDAEHYDATSDFTEKYSENGSCISGSAHEGNTADDSVEFVENDIFHVERDDENMDDDYGADDMGIADDIDSEQSSSIQQRSVELCGQDLRESKWSHVRRGTKIIVQVAKEGLGTKGPALSPYPHLRSRFWILISRCNKIGISKKITGAERTRLRVIAKSLQPPGFGLTVRTVAAGHSLEELNKDLNGLLSTWKGIIENAKSAALAADEGVEGAVPILLHRAMSKTLSVVQDYFNEKVKNLVVDSARTYHEVSSYLQDIAPELCTRVELYKKKTPIFDEYNIEEQIDSILCKRVPLENGGSLVIEQTEALVSIDVNGGHIMLGQGTSQEKAVLDVNLAAAKQIARELRLRDIGGIIVVDFIDMDDDVNRRLVYEEVKKAVERDKSTVRVSELSKHGLMEITRKRVRPSVSFMISEPCIFCHATGRVEALETSFSKIEREICRLLAASDKKPAPQSPKSWPKFVLRVDRYMSNYLTSGKRTKLAALSSSLKVWILLKVARGFSRGSFEVVPFSDDNEKSEQQHVAISRLRPTEARACIPSPKLTIFPVKKWRSGK